MIRHHLKFSAVPEAKFKLGSGQLIHEFLLNLANHENFSP